jgi:hypothetical protein
LDFQIISLPLESAKDNDGERPAAAVVSGPTTVTMPVVPAPAAAGPPDQPTLFLGIANDIAINYDASVASTSFGSSSSKLFRLNLSHVTAAPSADAGLTTRREYAETEAGDIEQFRHESMLLRCAQVPASFHCVKTSSHR